MESVKGRLRVIEKVVGALLAPRTPTFPEAHALMVAAADGDAEAAGALAFFARTGGTRVASPDGRVALDWSEFAPTS